MLFGTQFQYFVLIPIKIYSFKKYQLIEKWNGKLRMKLKIQPQNYVKENSTMKAPISRTISHGKKGKRLKDSILL